MRSWDTTRAENGRPLKRSIAPRNKTGEGRDREKEPGDSMSIFYGIKCNVCGSAYQFPAPTLSTVRKMAKSAGWEVAISQRHISGILIGLLDTKQTCDLCPECHMTRQRQALHKLTDYVHSPKVIQ